MIGHHTFTKKPKLPILLLIIVLALFSCLMYSNFIHRQSPKVTLDIIFGGPIDRGNESKDAIAITATGDVSLAHGINDASVNRYGNFIWPFDNISGLLKQSDATVINLESPIFSQCPAVEPKYYVLCADERFADGLKKVGIDVVNVANNHVADYGVKKALENIKSLIDKNIVISGARGNDTMRIRGIDVAFIGFNDIRYNNIGPANEKGAKSVIDWADDPKKVATAIKSAKEKNDVVVVSFHWGKEYTEKVTDRQRTLAHLAIDSGADLVLGNHSHWIQPIEVYRDKIVVYSHGSLVFDLESFKRAERVDERNRIGLIGEYYFSRNKFMGVKFIPVRINNENQPVVLKGKGKEEILNRLKIMSYGLLKGSSDQ